MRSFLAAMTLAALVGCDASKPPAPSLTFKPLKPDPAVDLTARVVGDPKGGGTCGLLVHAAPRFDGDFEIEVTLPDGVTQAAGETTWKGQGRAHITQELKLDFLNDGKRHEIVVRATATADGSRQTAVLAVVINEDGSVPPSKGTPKTNSRGEKIVEFQER